MSDTTDTKVLFTGTSRYIVRLINICDGTGESGVVKFDSSTLTGPTGVAGPKAVIEEIQWSINGFTSVRLYWDADADDEIAVLGTGNGYLSFKNAGGLVDPVSTGSTKDIKLTTAGNVSGATYDITLVIRLKA